MTGEDVLDLERIDTAELSPFNFHAALDLTDVHFESEQNFDECEKEEVLPLHPMLMFEYRFDPQLRAFLEIEWEGHEDMFELEQACGGWSPLEDLLRLSVGPRCLPSGVFRFFHYPSGNNLVDEPPLFRAVYPEVNPDLGIVADGEYVAEEFSIGYEVALSNGLHGPSRQAAWGDFSDNNDSGTLTGRISFAPADNLTLGASSSSGQHGKDDKLLANFHGFDVQYRLHRIQVRAEWCGGLVERSNVAGGDYHRKAWYVELMRPWPVDREYLLEIQTVFRYDNLDANDKTRDHVDAPCYAFGINFVPTDHLRWKLQYLISDDRYDDVANDGFVTQVAYHW